MNTAKLPEHCRYEMRLTHRWPFSEERRYVAEGRFGAVEFWVRDLQHPAAAECGRWSAGFETHSPTPTECRPPAHGECWALSGRCCWHDGSSLYAEESWLPAWLRNPHDHHAIFRRLAEEYMRRFEPQEPKP